MKNFQKFLTVFFSLAILCMAPGCKKNELPDPMGVDPPKDTTYTLTYKDGTVSIVNDTLYKKYRDVFDFSWEFKGKQTFEILLNSQHLSYDTIGKKSIVVEQQLVFNFLVNGKKVKSQVIVLVSDIPYPTITISGDTSIPYGGSTNISWIIEYATAQYLNGSQIPAVGSLPLNSLKRDTILHFGASNSNGVKYTNRDITIHVGPPPPPTPLQNLQSGKWYMKVWKIDGQNLTIPDCQKDDYMIYFDYMWYEKHRGVNQCVPGENELFANGSYSLYYLNDTLRLETNVGNGTIRNVLFISPSELKLEFKVYCVDPGCVSYEVYNMEYTHEP